LSESETHRFSVDGFRVRSTRPTNFTTYDSRA